MKILIVDDSEPMRQLISTFITDLSGAIFECGDGSEALAAYRKHRPDIVLMDLKMAGMDGLTATQQIRQYFPEAKIVIVSQWDDPPLPRGGTSGRCGDHCQQGGSAAASSYFIGAMTDEQYEE